MEIVKKNILSIICGVVILLAVAALFWPISGIVAGAQAQADERQQEYEKLASKQKQSRKLPVVSLDSNAPTTSLDQFPGPKVIEVGQNATKAMAEQSAGVLATAVAMNEHTLLVPKSLPTPTDRHKFDFRTAYRKRIRDEVPVILHATLPPTDKDLDEAEKKLWEEKFVPKIVWKTEKDPANPNAPEIRTALNEATITAQYNDEAAKLPEKIRTERAEQFHMYIDDGALSVSEPVIGEGPTPSVEQMWWAQNALWVEEDVCRAIARLNSIAKNTLDSPVKRLVTLTIDAVGPTQYVLAAPSTAAPTPDQPAPVVDPNAPIEKKFDRSPTGRVSNGLYDVVQFTVEMNVDARMITMLLAELSREKFFNAPAKQGEPTAFITVNKFDMASVNKTEAMQAGFVYGEAPIVKVSLQCEALLLRKWTTPYMPTEVKKILGIETAKPAEGTTAQAQ
jgi:hypothetical protein